MPLPPDYQAMGSAILIEAFLAAASEKALLTYSDAPLAELRTCQRKIDQITQEILRRMSW